MAPILPRDGKPGYMLVTEAEEPTFLVVAAFTVH